MPRTSSLVWVLGFALALASGCSKSAAQDQNKEPASQAEHAAAQTAAQSGAAASLPDRDPALAHKLVSEGALLLDVRTPEEFAERHLDNAMNVPVSELESRLEEIQKHAKGDKTKPIVVYCQAGGRAGKAKTVLAKAGFTQVTNLGGIDAWDAK